jgi:hypothetical protein
MSTVQEALNFRQAFDMGVAEEKARWEKRLEELRQHMAFLCRIGRMEDVCVTKTALAIIEGRGLQ